MLSDRLSLDLKQAMKRKETSTVSVLRMVKSAMKNAAIDSTNALTDVDVVAIIQKELKQKRESLEQFELAHRDELATEEKKQIAILEAYLPEQLSNEEVTTLVEEAISVAGASSSADVGKVMSIVMPKIKGRFDGSVAQKMVRDRLASS